MPNGNYRSCSSRKAANLRFSNRHYAQKDLRCPLWPGHLALGDLSSVLLVRTHENSTSLIGKIAQLSSSTRKAYYIRAILAYLHSSVSMFARLLSTCIHTSSAARLRAWNPFTCRNFYNLLHLLPHRLREILKLPLMLSPNPIVILPSVGGGCSEMAITAISCCEHCSSCPLRQEHISRAVLIA